MPEVGLQSFLLEELRRRAAFHDGPRRRPPHSLAQVEPQELADLLSWSTLQRFVTERAVQQVNPGLWFVDDLERRLRRRTSASRGASSGSPPLRAPRGVWVTAVSSRVSLPVAWRVLEEDGKQKEWRTRLALELVDALPQPDLDGAVVAADTSYSSLSGFRVGLETRGLPYLLRVDAVTAARELAPGTPSRSAAEARAIVSRRLDVAAESASRLRDGERSEPELLLVQGSERLLLCKAYAAEQTPDFWLSNLPAATDPERLAGLLRLADRHRAERDSIHELLLRALETHTRGGRELRHCLAAVALAQTLGTLDPAATPVQRTAEA